MLKSSGTSVKHQVQAAQDGVAGCLRNHCAEEFSPEKSAAITHCFKFHFHRLLDEHVVKTAGLRPNFIYSF